MNNKPQISIIMSVYNGQMYLKEAIDSILNQTFKNFEFIIIDDNSSDNSGNILKSYNDNRIKIVRNEVNIGLTKSLNKAISISDSAYIARMDCDDISEPQRLEIQKKFLDTNPEIICVGSKTITIDHKGLVTGQKSVETNTDVIAFKMLMINQIAHSSVMMRSGIIKDLGGYNEDYKYTQDYELWSRLIENGYKISNIDLPLIKYRYHGNSITQNRDTKDKAYDLVIKTTRRSINRYLGLSDKQLFIFTSFFHKYKIESIINLIILTKIIIKLTLAYTKNMKSDTKKLIWNCSKIQITRSLKCYLINLIKNP